MGPAQRGGRRWAWQPLHERLTRRAVSVASPKTSLQRLKARLLVTSTEPAAQMPVELCHVGERARVRHERVAARVADEVLDRALLVAGSRQ